MALFRIVDQNENQLIVETHYYNWLKQENPSEIHKINTKIKYLQEQGFIKGLHGITTKESDTLNHIENFYFDREIKPNLKSYEKRY